MSGAGSNSQLYFVNEIIVDKSSDHINDKLRLYVAHNLGHIRFSDEHITRIRLNQVFWIWH